MPLNTSLPVYTLDGSWRTNLSTLEEAVREGVMTLTLADLEVIRGLQVNEARTLGGSEVRRIS